MAESQSMTSAGVVAKALIEEHADFLRESVAMIAAEIMEAEIERQIGARRGEISEARSTHRNGYRQRPWATRVGEIELAVPRKRSGESYFPSFLEPRKRSEKALLGVVMEAYVNGVSTRKVDHLVAELGIQMSKDQVSRICRSLDGQVDAFRNRPLEGTYPYLWLDAKHLKVRDRGHVRSKALMVAFAVHESGRREVIGIEIAESETEAGWAAFLRELRARGLGGVRLAVSDDHLGLKAGRQGDRLPLAALHRALHPQHARPLQEGPAQHGRRRSARGLQRRGPRRRARAIGLGDRASRPDGAEGGGAARGGRGGSARLLPFPGGPLVKAALDQQHRARQQGDRPPL